MNPMQENQYTPEEAQRIATALAQHLKTSLTSLDQRTRKIEKELDIETANLEDLSHSSDPEIERQLKSLGGSIRSLHENMSQMRAELQEAYNQANILKEMFIGENSGDSSPKENEVRMTPRQAAHERHDAPITLSSIIRSLLMANEPQQLERRKNADQ